MTKLAEVEVDKEMEERLEERAFIEWMIEGLDRDQLSLLLMAADIKLADTAMEKLPMGFIRNKLLLKSARRRLRRIKSTPPFHFMLSLTKEEQEEQDEKDLVRLAEENNCKKSEIGLILFSKNYYEQALTLYDNREVPTVVEKKVEVVEIEKLASQPAIKEQEQLSPKIEKRLQQKIKVLTGEKENLHKQVKKLKDELKEKKRTSQHEINELKQELAKENIVNQDIITENNELRLVLEGKRKNHEALQFLQGKNKVVKAKSKIAFIGNPMNTSILSSEKFQVAVYELSILQDFVRDWMDYKHVIYLRYTLDEVSYESSIPAEIRTEIIIVDHFMELKKMMGEL